MGGKSKKVDIKKIPTAAVSGLAAPSRKVDGAKAVFTTSWKYPKACFNEQKDDRFEGVMVRWIIDTDSTGSTAQKTTKKVKTKVEKTDKKGKVVKDKNKKPVMKTVTTKIKTTTVTGVQKSAVILQRKKGDKVTSASASIDRNKYYPFAKSKITMVNLYKVKDPKWNDRTKTWALGTPVSGGQKTLSEMNKIVKNKTNPSVYSQSALMKFPKNKNPKNKIYYKTLKAPNLSVKSILAPYLYGVGVQVQGWNSKSPHTTGKAKKDKGATDKNCKWTTNVPIQSAYRAFLKPANPDVGVDSIGGEASGHVIKFVVDASADDGTKANERYESHYKLLKTTGFYSGKKFITTSNVLVEAKYRTDKTFAVSRNPNLDMPYGRTLLSLAPNEYIKYELKAKNMGFVGDTDYEKAKTSFTFARPHDTSVKRVDKSGSHYKIQFETTSKGVRYTTKYTLQRLANYRPSGGIANGGYLTSVDDWTDAQWQSAAAAESSWTDVYSIGKDELKNGQAWFSDLVANATVDPFKRTYYRIMASNDIYGMPGTPSAPYVVPGFWKIPSAAGQQTRILSVTSTEDGKSLKVITAFMKTKTRQGGFYNSNGTEITWDTADYAWHSTQPPSAYDFKDDIVGFVKVANASKADKPVLKGVDNEWFYSTYYIRGVQPEERYYIKGRRFLKDTETRETDSYGPQVGYTIGGSLASVEVSAVAQEVKLNVPERLVSGKDLSVSWTYDSDSEQKEYDLLWAQSSADNGKAYAQTLVKKTDSAPYAVVKWDDVKNKVFQNSIYLAVKMRTDSGWSNMSDIKTVKVVEPPKASLSKINTLVNQPLIVTLGTNNPSSSAVVRVISNQVIDWGPDGPNNQADGEIIHTNKLFTPNWQKTTLSDGTTWYYYNYTLPICDLRDNGFYTVEYTAVLDEYDLDSDTVDDEGNVVKQTQTFTVDYPEDIVVPNFYLVADNIDEEHGGSVKISIPDVTGNKGCVADIYRVTPDGSYLLRGNIENWRNATVTDTFPPYSRHEPCVYRLCMRSPNGVRQWADRSYSMPGYSVRFDWGEEEAESHGGYSHLTLPYNLKWSDNWTKNARIDLHLDGTYNGYWRGGVDHKNTLSTEIVKLTGAEQVARVMALAKYAGPVLVRLPNGCAFCANVNVTNLDVSYDSLVISASFSAQEIQMPAKYSDLAASVDAGLYVPRG